jgi:hypothetical protein
MLSISRYGLRTGLRKRSAARDCLDGKAAKCDDDMGHGTDPHQLRRHHGGGLTRKRVECGYLLQQGLQIKAPDDGTKW